MIPNFINSSPAPFPVGPSEDHDQPHQFFLPNYKSEPSSSSLSCRVFFNSSQDQTEYNHTVMHQPQHQQEDEYHAGLYDLEKKDGKSLKLSLWKNGKQTEENPAKWMSSKMRLMQKMKNSTSSSTSVKLEDQKEASSSFEADNLSGNSSTYSSNPHVRVCADCNTTKTPLWRSGPKGPKSLCNACGIRQRKATRAMAAAAAAANGTSLTTETATLKIKVRNKEKIKGNGHGIQFKKRCKLTSESSHRTEKKNVFEDFLFNLSKNLAFHRVFPQDEKEAAILLMALSIGKYAMEH